MYIFSKQTLLVMFFDKICICELCTLQYVYKYHLGVYTIFCKMESVLGFDGPSSFLPFTSLSSGPWKDTLGLPFFLPI